MRLTTSAGEFVLTLFERLTAEQLPFYLRLMKHLAQRGLPVPEPRVNPRSQSLLHSMQGKPAAVVNKLIGQCQLAPGASDCAAIGAMLARLHLLGRDFALQQPNLRGLAWWNETVPVVLPYVNAEQADLLRAELAYQNHVAASAVYAALPRGAVHADLFRDNVMFANGAVSGIFDFYFAGVDAWAFDLAVALNDWCVDLSTGGADLTRTAAFLHGYNTERPLQAAERQLLPAMLRAGALRFWISRLWDFFLPRQASMLKAHDPEHFERVLRRRLSELDNMLIMAANL